MAAIVPCTGFALFLRVAALAMIAAPAAVKVAHAQDVFSAHGAVPAACHTVAEVEPTFFATTQTATFDFTGNEAARLSAAADMLSGDGATEPASAIHLVVQPAVGVFNVFFFGADGCYTGMVVGLSFVDIATMFSLAEVAQPKTLVFYERPSIAI